MEFIEIEKSDHVTSIFLSRGKANAINQALVAELRQVLRELKSDSDTRAIILSGRGKFFSFGFDIPEFLNYSRDDFAKYLKNFTSLYTELFLYPKPLIAALNGHTIAGGCMLATATDYRLMVSGKAKIALNEIGFGSSVFAGCVEMLRYCCGNRNAEKILLEGSLYPADKALELRLIDKITSVESIQHDALKIAKDFAKKDMVAFSSLKNLLRGPVAKDFTAREEESLREFIDIWYSESTWENLKEITIRS